MLHFLSSDSKAVRAWLYGVGAAIVALAVVYGFVADEQSVAILALLQAILLAPAIESGRRPRHQGRHVRGREVTDPAESDEVAV